MANHQHTDPSSLAGIPVVAVAGSYRDGWTVLRTCDFSKHAEPLGRRRESLGELGKSV